MKHTIQQRINIAVVEKYGAISNEAAHLLAKNRMVTELIGALELAEQWAAKKENAHEIVQSLRKIIVRAKRTKEIGDTLTLP